MYVAIIAAAVPTPTPTGPPADLVTPGPIGFAAIAFITVAVILLILDMLRRIRRGRYREEINAELDAEERARAAERGSEAGDDSRGADGEGGSASPLR